MNKINRNNFGAEVVSAGELFKALKSGFDPSNIIFDGPGKTEFDLKYAITQQIRSINIENLDESAKGFPIARETFSTSLNRVLSNSFGFGGTNATLIFEKT